MGAGELATHVQELVAAAKAHMAKAQAYQKAHFDRSHRSTEFEVGDMVLLSTKNLHLAGSRKLKQRFTGPFKVLERLGKTAYKLELQGRFTSVHPVFHVSQLRRHTPGGSSEEPPAPIEVEGEAHFEIEALLRHRKRGNSFQYLVRWSGYGAEDDEWVHEGELDHARQLLDAYKTQHGLS